MLLVRLGFERLQLGVFDPCVLTLSDLVAAHGLVALDHDLTDWTKDLIAHPRAALFVQQLKANITIRDQPFATGTVILSIGCPLGSMTKATVEFSRSHIPVR